MDETSPPLLSPADVAFLRAQLAEQRAAATTQVADLTRELTGIFDAAALGNTDDEHDPEGATIAWERAQVTALLAQARTRLAELDRARERLDAGTYGGCERCGGAIAAERLAARPAATTCLRCAAARSR